MAPTPDPIDPSQAKYEVAMERLKVWAALHVGLIVGMNDATDPKHQGLRDIVEMLLALRVEQSAMTLLLFNQSETPFTQEHFRDYITAEATAMDIEYMQRFPGVRINDAGDGLDFYDLEQALTWMPATQRHL